MQVKNTKEKLAKKLAKKYKPIFIQEYGSPYDLFSRINLGDWVVELKKPFVYMAVREDDTNYYIWYLIYHYKDWSNWIKPFRSLDEHRHDLQGVMLAVNKLTENVMWHVAREHYKLNPRKNVVPRKRKVFSITAGGHAIRHNVEKITQDANYVYYMDYTLINILSKKGWNFIENHVSPAFKTYGVDFPWSWNDSKIQKKFGLRTDGLIWDDPREFYRLAKKSLII